MRRRVRCAARANKLRIGRDRPNSPTGLVGLRGRLAMKYGMGSLEYAENHIGFFSAAPRRGNKQQQGRLRGPRGRAALAPAVAKALEPLERRRLLTAVVQTDQADYAPGSTAHVTAFNDASAGVDFAVGETVQFQVLRSTGANVPPGHEPWRVTDGYTGAAYLD